MLSGFDIQFPYPLLAFFIFFGSIALAILAYKNASVSFYIKLSLIILRSLSLALLALLLLEPVFEWQNQSVQKSKLAVFVDHSKSMRLDDFGIKRDSNTIQAYSFLDDHLKDSLSLKLYAFGKSIREIPKDSLHFDDPITNMASIFNVLEKEDREKKIRGAILLSDGQINQGEEPVVLAKASATPINAVLIGDPKPKKDLKISRVIAPDKAYLGTEIPISIIIQQNGFQDKSIKISLSGNKRRLETKALTLSSREHTVKFTVTPDKLGVNHFRTALNTFKDDVSPNNNRYDFKIEILDQRKHLLVISGYPEPDLSALLSTLNPLKNFTVSKLVQKSPGNFIGKSALLDSREKLHAIILIGFPTKDTDQQSINKIRNLLKTKKPALFVWITRQTALNRLSGFESFLPFAESSPQLKGMALETFLEPGPDLMVLPFSAALLSDYRERLTEMPPVGFVKSNLTPKKGSSVVWIEKSDSKTAKPFFWLFNETNQKSGVICGDGLWRWRLNANPLIRELYQQTLVSTMEWLSENEEINLLSIFPKSGTFDEHLKIKLSAFLQNHKLIPIENARINLEVLAQNSQKKLFSTFKSMRNGGDYQTDLGLLPSGNYSYKATAYVQNSTFAEASGIFQVQDLGLEFLKPEANQDLMEDIARTSGGKFYTTERLKRLVKDIKTDPRYKPTAKTNAHNFELASQTSILFLILGLLSLEWFIRKLLSMP